MIFRLVLVSILVQKSLPLTDMWYINGRVVSLPLTNMRYINGWVVSLVLHRKVGDFFHFIGNFVFGKVKTMGDCLDK